MGWGSKGYWVDVRNEEPISFAFKLKDGKETDIFTFIKNTCFLEDTLLPSYIHVIVSRSFFR